ncbi:MAG: hypothetical protein A2945_00885 [Candidatus Liptonbacteria bacterium RIFCSPLOWO2_01_FULL_52_25]|uniref:Uncharacterized protein n=1 Tax=Candidatus Liptonbacteria bacterium RIFCSPLOWO2_01_FULL_52_25 TaxID=1798650 RepID=A0A1G2CDU4_9BACT|nr:MAG: hypothetical protein A2945_00885 [Candidatus Liptonbacteria bacterium RIFCSPLOWO2_01_FULL_52_25]
MFRAIWVSSWLLLAALMLLAGNTLLPAVNIANQQELFAIVILEMMTIIGTWIFWYLGLNAPGRSLVKAKVRRYHIYTGEGR